MEYIKGFTFAPFAGAGNFDTTEARESLRLMKERTGANFVTFVPGGLQKTAHSEDILYTTDRTMTDDELCNMIDYAKKLGLRVALKPTVNCMDGTWRAFISFFDEDVVCEPKWGNWFKSYTDFQVHYARIAKEHGCELFIAGCELVMSEHREKEWRDVIAAIRSVYDGAVSYNTDKYQEHNVSWWDCVDIISSSGYYPLADWDRQLDRIEAVVEKYNKPFFFAETGCMSVAGSPEVPNNWEVKGESDLDGHAVWFDEMLSKCMKRPWLKGICIWSWSNHLYDEADINNQKNYEVYLKPAERVINAYYCNKEA